MIKPESLTTYLLSEQIHSLGNALMDRRVNLPALKKHLQQWLDNYRHDFSTNSQPIDGFTAWLRRYNTETSVFYRNLIEVIEFMMKERGVL